MGGRPPAGRKGGTAGGPRGTATGGYKIPRRIRFVEALPKSALGKVLKTELRKRYAG